MSRALAIVDKLLEGEAAAPGPEKFDAREYLLRQPPLERYLDEMGFDQVAEHRWILTRGSFFHAVELRRGKWHYKRIHNGENAGGAIALSADEMYRALRIYIEGIAAATVYNEIHENSQARPDNRPVRPLADVGAAGKPAAASEAIEKAPGETPGLAPASSFDVRKYLLSGQDFLVTIRQRRTGRLFYWTDSGWRLDKRYARLFTKEDAEDKIAEYGFGDEFDLRMVNVNEAQDFDAREYFLAGNPYPDLERHLRDGCVGMRAWVERLGSSRYVHERTTNFDAEIFDTDWPQDWTKEQADEVFERFAVQLNALSEVIQERMVAWNRKIYSELEAAWAHETSEDSVAHNIEANDYEFTREGRREDGTGIRYAGLSPEAKEMAREWWIEGSSSDDYFAEPVIREWKWLLQQKGFTGVDIAYSGFGSQGDGASFTAKNVDLLKYLEGPDPLEFPESQRQQFVGEARIAEADQPFDARDYILNPPDKAWAVVVNHPQYGELFFDFNHGLVSGSADATRFSDRRAASKQAARYRRDGFASKVISVNEALDDPFDPRQYLLSTNEAALRNLLDELGFEQVDKDHWRHSETFRISTYRGVQPLRFDCTVEHRHEGDEDDEDDWVFRVWETVEGVAGHKLVRQRWDTAGGIITRIRNWWADKEKRGLRYPE